MQYPLALIRFFKYTSVGISTFILDIALLFFLVEGMGWSYLLSTGIAFLVAVSLNYFISREYVFRGSPRGCKAGYIHFITVAIAGMTLALGGMKICVDILGWNYLFARTLIAGIIGIGNYLFNLFINFQVAGKH